MSDFDVHLTGESITIDGLSLTIAPNSSRVIASISVDGAVEIDWAAVEEAAAVRPLDTMSFFAVALLAVRDRTAKSVQSCT